MQERVEENPYVLSKLSQSATIQKIGIQKFWRKKSKQKNSERRKIIAKEKKEDWRNFMLKSLRKRLD